MGRQDEFFHEVVKFMLEVAFVTQQFYSMPKKRAGFMLRDKLNIGQSG